MKQVIEGAVYSGGRPEKKRRKEVVQLAFTKLEDHHEATTPLVYNSPYLPIPILISSSSHVKRLQQAPLIFPTFTIMPMCLTSSSNIISSSPVHHHPSTPFLLPHNNLASNFHPPKASFIGLAVPMLLFLNSCEMRFLTSFASSELTAAWFCEA